jgi:hypothetical protein
MLLVEHRLKTLDTSQVMTVEVAGPAPASHLFLCSGRIHVEAARVVERTGLINMRPDDPLPLSFILPDNNRQYFSLSTSAGVPLRILSAQANATFPIIDIGDYTLPRRREIRSVEIRQQDAHVLVVIYLYVNATDVEVTMHYQASILAGPAL